MTTIPINQNRIESLDWLRGMMAVSVMAYHFHGFLFYWPKADSTLGRLGIYAVSLFFILSGLSIAIVYNRFIKDPKTSFFFFIRRIFRIWPLFWVLILLRAAVSLMRNDPFSLRLLFLNLTTLFGFISPGSYILTGAWSIGNEMVYYALTPLIIWLFNKNLRYGNLFVAVTVTIGLLFSFFILTPDKTLEQQWEVYINPFNNLFLYSTGIGMYYNFRGREVNRFVIGILLFFSVIAFIMLPYTGDQINLVTGSGRIAFSLMSIIIVFSFYKLVVILPHAIETPLGILGMSTYSIYLLHPVIFSLISGLSTRLNIVLHPGLKFVSAAAVTIAASFVSYTFFEKKFMRLGKNLTSGSPASSDDPLRGKLAKA
jgi:exopolysaccharide production protein ExoZ